MSLPSQTARTSPAGRPFVYRRRRSRRKPAPLAIIAGGVAVVVLVVGGIFLFGPSWGRASDSETLETAVATSDPLLPDPVRNRPSVVIDQGSMGRSTADRTARPEQAEPARAATPVRSPEPVQTQAETSVPSPPPLPSERGILDQALASADEEQPVSNSPAAREPARQPARETAATKDSNPARVTKVHLDAADSLLRQNDPLAARQALWDAMRMPGLDELELSVLRARLTELNKELVFSPRHVAGDPLSMLYTVRAGDALSRIERTQGLTTHWKLIQRLNGLSRPDRINAGQRLKLIPGPFHAVVTKSRFRLDLYHGPTERPEEWVFIRSFDVGLGEGDSTPTGHFIVRANGKLESPGWVNPRNPSERYAPNDPNNPIGDFWIGLDGLGDAAAYAGYGLHGTIEPDSIGEERSMGCVRMRPDDIALMYELLGEGKSLVQIRR